MTSPPTPSPVRDFTPDTVDSEGGVLPDVVDTPSPAGMMVPTESPTFSVSRKNFLFAELEYDCQSICVCQSVQ